MINPEVDSTTYWLLFWCGSVVESVQLAPAGTLTQCTIDFAHSMAAFCIPVFTKTWPFCNVKRASLEPVAFNYCIESPTSFLAASSFSEATMIPWQHDILPILKSMDCQESEGTLDEECSKWKINWQVALICSQRLKSCISVSATGLHKYLFQAFVYYSWAIVAWKDGLQNCKMLEEQVRWKGLSQSVPRRDPSVPKMARTCWLSWSFVFMSSQRRDC